MGVDDPHQRLHLPTDGDESRDEARHGLDRVLLRHGETREDGPYHQLGGVRRVQEQPGLLLQHLVRVVRYEKESTNSVHYLTQNGKEAVDEVRVVGQGLGLQHGHGGVGDLCQRGAERLHHPART